MQSAFGVDLGGMTFLRHPIMALAIILIAAMKLIEISANALKARLTGSDR